MMHKNLSALTSAGLSVSHRTFAHWGVQLVQLWWKVFMKLSWAWSSYLLWSFKYLFKTLIFKGGMIIQHTTIYFCSVTVKRANWKYSVCPSFVHDNLKNKWEAELHFSTWLHLGVRMVPFENWAAKSNSKMATVIFIHKPATPNIWRNYAF